MMMMMMMMRREEDEDEIRRASARSLLKGDDYYDYHDESFTFTGRAMHRGRPTYELVSQCPPLRARSLYGRLLCCTRLRQVRRELVVVFWRGLAISYTSPISSISRRRAMRSALVRKSIFLQSIFTYQKTYTTLILTKYQQYSPLI